MSRQQKQPPVEKDLISLIIEGDYKNAKDKAFADGINRKLNIDAFIKPLSESRPDYKPFPNLSILELSAINGRWDFVQWMLQCLDLYIQKERLQLSEEQKQSYLNILSSLLLHAVFANQPEVVSDLLKKGADPNEMLVSTGKYVGTSALDWAIHHFSMEMVKDLIEAGANPVLSGVNNQPCSLKLAVEKARHEGEEYWNLIPILANKPAEDEITIRAYSDALTIAAVYGQTEIVIHLLSVGADPNLSFVKGGSKAMQGWTALHFAHYNNDPTMAIYLMAAGANPDLAGESNVPTLTFRDLAEGKNQDIDISLKKEMSDRTSEDELNTLQAFATKFPIRKPKLPGPTGIAVVLLAVKSLLATLTLRICVALSIISKKELEVIKTTKKVSVEESSRISPAADRFFQSRTPRPPMGQSCEEQQSVNQKIKVGM